VKYLRCSAKASGSGANGSGPILSFSGDAEDLDDVIEREGEGLVDLLGKATQAGAEEVAEGDEDDDGEEVGLEDDFNAAWEVLDLARAIYEKQKEKDGDEEVMLKLADTYITLGDVSLETGAPVVYVGTTYHLYT
jgi:HAT1-interacting factor 1